MLEFENNNHQNNLEDIQKEESLDTVLEGTTAIVPLDVSEREIVNKIIEANTKTELEEQFELFNMNQSKKNALRIIKLNNLLDKVEDQAIQRFEKRPDQVSNKELLEYMQVVANQIDKSRDYIETIQNKPMIKVNNQKNEVNINLNAEPLDRDEKAAVIDAVNALLKQIKQPNNLNNDIIIDAEEAEIIDNNQNFSENNVLLNTEDNSEEEIK